MMITRRSFLQHAAAVTAGFTGLRHGWTSEPARHDALIRDPDGFLDLPPGFTYHAFSEAGERMDDGLIVPALHDGMGAFPGPGGKTILVRNHELSQPPAPNAETGEVNPFTASLKRIPSAKFYDAMPAGGGTTTLIYDTKRRRLERHHLSLMGTCRNCAGGPTPWGSWITCEETELTAGGGWLRDHGYNFEVPAAATGLVDPIPLTAMGRFKHEAIAVDPRTGIIYQTEDQSDGLIYRFVPRVPGKPALGGKLEALTVVDRASLDTRNWMAEDGTALSPRIEVGVPLVTRWLPLEDVEARQGPLRNRGFAAGAACFARGEGMWFGRDAVYFTATNGGRSQLGQIWRYTPGPEESRDGTEGGRLELFLESTDRSILESPDNLTFAPWGDLFVCEDGPAHDRIIQVSPDGHARTFAANRRGEGELAGGVFSPDGSTLFVNAQKDGITLAITGPWTPHRHG